jgi:hypothetical protein
VSSPFVLFVPGLLLGLLVWSRINHLFLAAVGLKYGMRLPPPSDESRLMRLFLFFMLTLVSVWSLLFGFVAYHFRDVGSLGWSWFFLGVTATPWVVIPAILRVWRHRQASAGQHSR